MNFGWFLFSGGFYFFLGRFIVLQRLTNARRSRIADDTPQAKRRR
jgi:hypothetical protein